MSLPEQAIREFKAIYAEEFGEELSYDEAEYQANNLHSLFLFLLQDAE
jgi:hypothetical protein